MVSAAVSSTAVVSSNKNKLQKTVLFLALLFSIQLHAQKIEGVWEGTLIIRGDVKTTMRIRMEIVEKDSSYFGILYYLCKMMMY